MIILTIYHAKKNKSNKSLGGFFSGSLKWTWNQRAPVLGDTSEAALLSQLGLFIKKVMNPEAEAETGVHRPNGDFYTKDRVRVMRGNRVMPK